MVTLIGKNKEPVIMPNQNSSHLYLWPVAPMKRLASISLAIFFSFASQNLSASEIYKWVDADGKVHYSGTKPIEAESERVNVQTGKTGMTTGAETVDKLKQEAEDEAEKIKEEGIPAQPPVPSLPAKEVKRRCKAAKEDLATIQARGQLRERDEQGNTRYVSDEEKQRRINEAGRQIREYCN
jgi:hypothetical protein